MKYVLLVIKGFIMGVANLIPGVSGGTLALTLGIYENFIGAISHFFSNLKENLKFLFPVFIGIGLSILTMSGVITNSFDHYPIPTSLFFMGLVTGGIPMLIARVKGSEEQKQFSSYLILFATFLLVMALAFSKELFGNGLGDAKFDNLSVLGYLGISVIGMIAAATMVIPGVSGSLVLMLLGYYFPIMKVVKELTHFENIYPNFFVALFFGIGVLAGIILVAKWLLAKYEKKTFFGVIGFILASIIAIPVSVYHEVVVITFTIPQVLIGLIMFVLGIGIGYKLGEK